METENRTLTNPTLDGAAVFQPKQQRSQDTQLKLIKALHHCLQNKFFEHISIKEIAAHAGVSVGTFYRRFKDKESLLPLLYQEFGKDLELWVVEKEAHNYSSLADAIERITNDISTFLLTRKSLFRTIHLNSRLHAELFAQDHTVDRREIYKRLADILLRFSDEMAGDNKQEIANMAVFTMISTLLDKVLYPQLTPAIAIDIDLDAFAKALSNMLFAYLTTESSI